MAKRRTSAGSVMCQRLRRWHITVPTLVHPGFGSWPEELTRAVIYWVVPEAPFAFTRPQACPTFYQIIMPDSPSGSPVLTSPSLLF